MEIYTMTMQPSLPLTRACAPSTSMPVLAASLPVLAAERAPVSQVHQVSAQAELGVAWKLAAIEGTTSTTGFKGSNVSISKRYTDGGSGVPPRGRPV
ncbi:hypothetical protein M1L60_16925 [Actinoplanes sp. TRM 88003]|uniref:Uncharacterized protein n=1 Tax=Paractinoplanes aksuensis TaxID=2939490 RepID=A0ABT1DP75_9ACTN|nr:hypothetical protein [Actinoplanes aksuensis]MCO8272278.1 hypothetical protein [Actinoplanes aksuensis]